MKITTQFIKLDSFLKMVDAVGSGGEAKVLVLEGCVKVNDKPEMRRGRKLYPGDQVELGGKRYTID